MLRTWVAVVAPIGLVVAVFVVVMLVVDDDEEESSPQFEGALGSGQVSFVRHSGGWQIELDVDDLPRLDEGEFYQAWLKAEDGTLVPVGTFNEGDDVILWAGVSPADYPTFTVTRETADNDQESSGDRVLSGEIVPAD